MIEHNYTCTLLSDVVVNATLATEGNMSSLDYIPGSTLMGIVANPLYNEYKEHPEKTLNILHEAKVRFGDACISFQGQTGLPMPIQFFTDKEKKDLDKHSVYLGHFLEGKEIRNEVGKIQPQQVRSGYFVINGQNINYLPTIPKNFSLKSAHNPETRTANDSQMFGLEALPRGMQLAFSIQYDNPEDVALVEKYLIGTKSIGKSKSAEYGQAKIEKNKTAQITIPVFDLQEGVLVYAASNLCFYDKKNWNPNYQPTTEDLGLSGGEICWEKSHIRTINYTTWNTTRQTTNPVRYCIARGSVFFIKGAKTNQSGGTVGEWQTEGLGRVLYNPEFLKGSPEEGTSAFSGKFQKLEWKDFLVSKENPKVNQNPLLKWLQEKQQEKNATLALSKSVHKAIYADSKKVEGFKEVTSSQWGQIRQLASSAVTKEELALKLFDNPKKRSTETDGQHKARKGHLMHGVAYDRIWSKDRGKPIIMLKEMFEIQLDDQPHDHSRIIHCGKSKDFVALFAAEMAHCYIRKKNLKDHE